MKKVRLFLQTIELNTTNRLYETIHLFVQNRGNSVLYKDGQLFFMQEFSILNSKKVESSSDIIVEFDGEKMTRIDREYYLGETTLSAQRSDSDSNIMESFSRNKHRDKNSGSTNNNNNNNNNNNGNNNG